MSAMFDSSSSKLHLEDGTYHKSNNKRTCLLITAVAVLLVALIIVLVMYVQANNENGKLLVKVKDGSSGKTSGEDSSTTTIITPNVVTTKVPVTTNSPRVTTGKEPYMNIRLPKDVIPSFYNLSLMVDMSTKVVNGKVDIAITVKSPTKYFIIHAYDYTNILGFLKNSKNEILTAKDKYFYKKNHYYIIEMEKEVASGQYELQYEFDYTLKKTLKGFYQSTYKNEKNENKLVAATQFEPVSARVAFPCFDEPAMKANFSITIGHSSEYIAISNMPVLTTWMENNMKYDKFETSPKMPTYLVAFVVCDFANKTITASTRDPVQMTYYAPRDQIDQIDYSMTIGSKVLKYFEEYFNVSYPLPKADMIAIPDFAAGAMENWGLVTYRTSALLLDDIASAVSNVHRVNGVVSHELAHQWFGNIVTMDWWSDLWLNEGFASYVEYLGMNYTEPSWNVLDFQVVDDMASALSLDALVSSHPIYIPVNHPSEIDEIFDSISYAKGGSVLRMLNNFIGPDIFVQGLSKYLAKFSYRNAKTQDLFQQLALASKDAGDNYNIPQIMDTWVLQMGYPVINVTQLSDGSFKLVQERFLRDPNPDLNNTKFISDYGYKWIVPFNYQVLDVSDMNSVSIGDSKMTWLNMTDGSIPKPTSTNVIVKGNAGQYGFYRVNYEVNTWQKFRDVLKKNHKIFDVKDRAGLLSDAFALANSGRLGFDIAFEIFDYIGSEVDYIPWKAASSAIGGIPSLLPKTSAARKKLQKYQLSKVSKLFDKYQLKKQDDHLARYLQVLIAGKACGNGHQGCLSNATDLFQKWKADPENNPVPGDFRNLVYYYGVANGGVEEWDFVFKRYQDNKIASEKSKLLYALAGTKEAWLIDRYLNYALNESIIKSQDVSTVFSYVSNYNGNGRYQAWAFLKENWHIVEERYVESFFTMRRLFESVTGGFTTQYELDMMKLFVKTKIKNQGSAKSIIKQVEESIKSNIEWIRRNEKPISDWILAKDI